MTGGQQGGSTTVTQQLSPEQQQLYDLILPTAANWVQNPPQLWPGSIYPGFNPYQQMSQEMALGAAGGSVSDLAKQAAGTQKFLSHDVLLPETNPYLEQYAQAAIRPLEQQYTQTVLPGIRGDAIAAGGFGGSRQGVAEGIAAQNYMRQVGDTSAGIYNQGYAQGLDAMGRGLLLAPQTQAMQLMPADIYGAVGAQQYSLDQARLMEEQQRFFNEQYMPFLAAQQVAGIASGIPAGTTTTTGMPSSGGMNPFMGLMGGGLMGMSLMGPGGLFGAAGLMANPWAFGLGGALGLLGSFF